MKAPLSRVLVACLLLMRAGSGLAEPPLVLAKSGWLRVNGPYARGETCRDLVGEGFVR